MCCYIYIYIYGEVGQCVQHWGNDHDRRTWGKSLSATSHPGGSLTAYLVPFSVCEIQLPACVVKPIRVGGELRMGAAGFWLRSSRDEVELSNMIWNELDCTELDSLRWTFGHHMKKKLHIKLPLHLSHNSLCKICTRIWGWIFNIIIGLTPEMSDCIVINVYLFPTTKIIHLNIVHLKQRDWHCSTTVIIV